MKNSKRDEYIDILKGIGIVSIVVGHASWDINVGAYSIHVGPFVYLYHLAIFIFCSGYLFSEKCADFWLFVGKKIKSLYRPFLIWSLGYLCLRNIFFDLGILAGEKFGVTQYIISAANAIAFNSTGELLAALWFMPMMFYALMFYGAVFFGTNRIENEKIKEVLRIILYGAVGIIGLWATDSNLGLLHNIQISCLMVPVVAFGYYFKKMNGVRYVNLICGIIAVVIMVYVIETQDSIIELSRNMIISKWLFYPITVCGICFCLSVGKTVLKWKMPAKMMSLIGSSSFEIMALHFMSFKIIDFVVCNLKGQTELLNQFPHSYTELWPAYYLFGIGFPILLKYIGNRIVQRRRRKSNEKSCFL